MTTAYVLIGLTAGTRPTSQRALTAAREAFKAQLETVDVALTIRFVGYAEPVNAMRCARYEANTAPHAVV